MEEKESVHQILMDESYKLWDKEGFNRLCYEDFLVEVVQNFGDLHFQAVITGNFNYQVENGGFSQWHDNEYSITCKDLISFLENNFEENIIIKKVVDLLIEVEEVLEWIEGGKSLCRRMDYDYRDFFENALEEKGSDDLQRLDSRYYQISKEFMEILNEYFTKNYNVKVGEDNKSTLAVTLM